MDPRSSATSMISDLFWMSKKTVTILSEALKQSNVVL